MGFSTLLSFSRGVTPQFLEGKNSFKTVTHKKVSAREHRELLERIVVDYTGIFF